MRAVFFPDFSAKNPYQRELKSHLESQGVSVAMHGDHGPAHWTRRAFPLLRTVYDSDPDVVHLHWIHPFFANDRQPRAVLGALRLVLELLVLRVLSVNVVWTIHNLLDHDRRLPKRLELVVRHVIFRLCDRVIVHCDRAGEVVARTYRLPGQATAKLRTIPHGHYIDSYPNEMDRTRARAELGLNGDHTVFLYFGRIREYKNVPELVETFRDLDREDVRLLVVGAPRTDAITAEVTARSASDERIRTVFEFVPEAEVQRYMNAADVVVLPFDDILSSGSALLAMSFGRPVVAPALGCVETLVTDGLTYDPAGTDGLAGALERALSADLQTIGRRNQRRAGEFDWDGIAAQTVAAYRQAAG